jgi:hypothetical protein
MMIERGADAERHPDLQRHADEAEAFVEHRHQDRAAADAEYAGHESGQGADRDQQQREFDDFPGIEAGDHVVRIRVQNVRLRVCTAAGRPQRDPPREPYLLLEGGSSTAGRKSAYPVGSG